MARDPLIEHLEEERQRLGLSKAEQAQRYGMDPAVYSHALVGRRLFSGNVTRTILARHPEWAASLQTGPA